MSTKAITSDTNTKSGVMIHEVITASFVTIIEKFSNPDNGRSEFEFITVNL